MSANDLAEQIALMLKDGPVGLATEGRVWTHIVEIVECDDDCGAYKEPETFDEYRLAWEHWRSHGSLSGCSHGR